MKIEIQYHANAIKSSDGYVDKRVMLQTSIFDDNGILIDTKYFDVPLNQITETIHESLLDRVHLVMSRSKSDITKDMIADAYSKLSSNDIEKARKHYE